MPSQWLVQVNPFYEHSSAGGAKVKGGVEVKEEGQQREGGKAVGTPFPNKLLPSSNQWGLERELFQICAGYKLELVQ